MDHPPGPPSRIKAAARSTWGASPAGTSHAPDLEVGTREFFERVLQRRSSYEMPFLDELIPYAEYRGRRVLEVGCGAGYDAHALARAGAELTAVDLTPENPGRTRDHLALFDLHPAVAVADAEHLPFPDASFDMVFSNGVLHHTADIAAAFAEIRRVLRPGGDFWVILYHRDSLFYWLTLWLCDHLLTLGFLRRSFRERLGMIEYTTGGDIPFVDVFSRWRLRRLLRDTGFAAPELWVRKLVWEDLPHLPYAEKVWRRLPRRLLDLMGRVAGWYVVARARPR